MSNWPPDYSVRKSMRAKRVILQISPIRGLEIVLPHKVRKINHLQFLEQHRSWIETQCPKIIRKQSAEIPEKLHIKSIGEIWHLSHHNVSNSIFRICKKDTKINIMGKPLQTQKLAHYLQKFLCLEAEKILLPWIKKLSIEFDLPFKKLTIRAQKTRWGSCSENGNISLNYKLIFLPQELTNHIILHELCHLRYSNHQSGFWALLTTLDPNTQKHNLQCKKACSYVPLCLE